MLPNVTFIPQISQMTKNRQNSLGGLKNTYREGGGCENYIGNIFSKKKNAKIYQGQKSGPKRPGS
jgi:hypothetical protein